MLILWWVLFEFLFFLYFVYWNALIRKSGKKEAAKKRKKIVIEIGEMGLRFFYSHFFFSFFRSVLLFYAHIHNDSREIKIYKIKCSGTTYICLFIQTVWYMPMNVIFFLFISSFVCFYLEAVTINIIKNWIY